MDTLLAILGCLLLSFLLSGLESAILSHSPARLRHAAKEGRRRAALVEKMLRKKDQLLASILILNATANLIGFALLTEAAVRWIGPWGYAAAFLVSAPIYLLWSESLPKACFKQAPVRLLTFFVPLLLLIYGTLRPLVALFALPGKWLGARLYEGTEKRQTLEPGETRAEFRALTEILERKGTLGADERELIEGVLDFQQTRVSEVMLPLSRVTAVPREMPIDSVISLARETRFDQFPIIGADGDLVGIVDVMELLRDRVKHQNLHEVRRDLVRCDPAEPASQVIKRLRRAGQRVAAVFNSRGRPVGIVSIQDMIGRLTLAAPTS